MCNIAENTIQSCYQGGFRGNLQTIKMSALHIGYATLLSLVIIYVHFSLDDSPFLRAGMRESKKEQMQIARHFQ